MPYPASGVFGKVEHVNLADPAAGNQIVITFDTTSFPNQANRVYELLAIRFQLQTSATVAVRTVSCEFRISAQLEYATTSLVTQAQSLTYNYVQRPGVAQSAALALNNRVINPLPSVPMLFVVDDGVQWQLRTFTNNMQAGDQFSQIWIQYRIFQQ